MKNSTTATTATATSTSFDCAWEALEKKFESLSGKAMTQEQEEALTLSLSEESFSEEALEEKLGLGLSLLLPELKELELLLLEEKACLYASSEEKEAEEEEEAPSEEKLTYALFSEASEAFMEKAEKLGFEESFASELLAKEGLLSEEEALAWAKLEPEASKAFNLGKALEEAIEKEAF